jgi:hypothetical protein
MRPGGIAGHRSRLRPQEALSETDAELPEHLELLRGLDSLGDDLRAGLGGEGAQRPHHRPMPRLVLGELDQGLVELDELRSEGEHVADARVARAHVVESDPAAALAHVRHLSRQDLRLREWGVLGELKDHPGDVVLGQARGERGRDQGLGRDVHGEEQVRRQLGELRQSDTHQQDLELGPDPRGLGSLQPSGYGRLGRGDPPEGLDPDRPLARQLDDRLEHDVDSRGAEEHGVEPLP